MPPGFPSVVMGLQIMGPASSGHAQTAFVPNEPPDSGEVVAATAATGAPPDSQVRMREARKTPANVTGVFGPTVADFWDERAIRGETAANGHDMPLARGGRQVFVDTQRVMSWEMTYESWLDGTHQFVTALVVVEVVEGALGLDRTKTISIDEISKIAEEKPDWYLALERVYNNQDDYPEDLQEMAQEAFPVVDPRSGDMLGNLQKLIVNAVNRLEQDPSLSPEDRASVERDLQGDIAFLESKIAAVEQWKAKYSDIQHRGVQATMDHEFDRLTALFPSSVSGMKRVSPKEKSENPWDTQGYGIQLQVDGDPSEFLHFVLETMKREGDANIFSSPAQRGGPASACVDPQHPNRILVRRTVEVFRPDGFQVLKPDGSPTTRDVQFFIEVNHSQPKPQNEG